MLIIKRANTIYEDGTTDCGYFIRECLGGFVLGAIVSIIVCSLISFSIYTNIKYENYIIPKNKSGGLYLQLDDGRLYKEQKRGN